MVVLCSFKPKQQPLFSFSGSHGIEVNITDGKHKLCLYANLSLTFSVSYEVADNKVGVWLSLHRSPVLLSLSDGLAAFSLFYQDNLKHVVGTLLLRKQAFWCKGETKEVAMEAGRFCQFSI